MKLLVGFARIVVGLLFIFSGLIKLNDPVGFSFKLKDYFAPEVLDLGFLVPYALLLAVVLVIIEVLLGIMLLLGSSKRFVLGSLLLMIIFFTFLTFYSAFYNKVTDCGCFGDAISLTPWQSFYKDIILLILILVLVIGARYIQPLFTKSVNTFVVFLSLIGCLAITYYVLQHLPIIDFRPYKINKNISEGMIVPEGAPMPVFEYRWKFKVDGEEMIFTTNGDYPSVEGEFIDVETKMIKPGYEPPIHDFAIEKNGVDYTERFLNQENLIVIIAYSLDNSEFDGFLPIKEITDEALKLGYHVIGLSASSDEKTDKLIEEYDLNFKFYFSDETTLKTIVRSNPGILELNQATILQKLHWNDAAKLKLQKLEKSKNSLDLNMKKRLDSIGVLDQKYRELMKTETPEARAELGKKLKMSPAEYTADIFDAQSLIDSANMVYVEGIFSKYGYPGKSMVGEPTNNVAYKVLQRNPEKIRKYLGLVKEAGKKGELSKILVATMEDQYLMNEGKPQIYGTQARIEENGQKFIWPIKDAENVNERRKSAGFNKTIEEYAIEIFGDDFRYVPKTIDQIKQ